MRLGNQIGPEFHAFDFTHDRRTYEVFKGGSGPAVLVLHEVPGLHPGVIDFAGRLIAAGYTVYLPSLFGRPAGPVNGREVVRSILQICVAREFTKLADRTSPVVGWLRALASSAYRECGGSGVGVVGMCFTGGFALATALEESVVASVLSQPVMPAPIGQRGRAALGLDAEDLDTLTTPSRHEPRTTSACSGFGSPMTGVALRNDSRPCGRSLGHLSRGSRSTHRRATRLASHLRRTRCSRSPSSTSPGIRPGSHSTGSWRSWPSSCAADGLAA